MTIEEAIQYFENIPRGSVIEIDPGAIVTALQALYQINRQEHKKPLPERELSNKISQFIYVVPYDVNIKSDYYILTYDGAMDPDTGNIIFHMKDYAKTNCDGWVAYDYKQQYTRY